MLASPVLNVGQATVTAFSFLVAAVGGGDGYNCQSYAPRLFRFYLFLSLFKDML